MKDYYLILGVLPDAEDVVIRAAYKALVQRYHPDRFHGDSAEAHRKTAELNEAYDVLSSPQKRGEYDRQRKSSKDSTSEYSEDEAVDSSSSNDIDEDWGLATQYYPDLIPLESRLRKISTALSVGFKQALLSTKGFDDRHKIAKVLEQRFLEVYFGSNPKVIEFALKLIMDGRREGAKELNRAINLLGSNTDPTPILDKLKSKHYEAGQLQPVESASNSNTARLKPKLREVKVVDGRVKATDAENAFAVGLLIVASIVGVVVIAISA